jgi:hypothetical protein
MTARKVSARLEEGYSGPEGRLDLPRLSLVLSWCFVKGSWPCDGPSQHRLPSMQAAETRATAQGVSHACEIVRGQSGRFGKALPLIASYARPLRKP